MDLKEWAELAKIVGIVVAGVWAVAVLFILKKPALARAELEQIALKAKRQAIISVEIQPVVRRNSDTKAYTVLAVVQLINKGDKITRIKYEEKAPFIVYQATFENEEVILDPILHLWVMQTRNPTSRVVSHIIRSGATESVSFLFPVSNPGIYLLAFAVPVSEEDRADARAVGASLPSVWSGRKYLFVDDAALIESGVGPPANRLDQAGTGEVEA